MSAKRYLLLAVLVASLVMLVGAIGSWSALRADDDSDQHLRGAFMVTATVPGFTPVKALVTYNRDGGLAAATTALNQIGPFLPPGTTSTAAFGQWMRIGQSRFASTFQAALSAGGAAIGFLRNRETVDLDSTGDGYAGTFTLDLLNPDGTLNRTLGGGTLAASRIKVVPQ